ncbi:MAG: proliferating cell nuclear antigen (pcna) [archaeon]
MKVTLADTKFIKEPVSIISDLVSEGTFKVDKDKIELIAMDPANVAMVIFRILSSTFVEYDVKAETSFSINLNNLKQVLRRIKGNDTMTLEVADSKFKLTLKGTSTRTFSLPLLDLEEKEQRMPDLKFAASIMLDSTALNDAIEDVDIVGESVTFHVEPKKFIISAQGDLNKAQIDIPEDANTKVDAKEKCRAKYSIEYLKKIIQGSKIADKVKVEFSKDYPLKIEYVALNKAQLAFILAPRVDTD